MRKLMERASANLQITKTLNYTEKWDRGEEAVGVKRGSTLDSGWKGNFQDVKAAQLSSLSLGWWGRGRAAAERSNC